MLHTYWAHAATSVYMSCLHTYWEHAAMSVCMSCLLHTYSTSFSLLLFYSVHFIDSKILPKTLAF